MGELWRWNGHRTCSGSIAPEHDLVWQLLKLHVSIDRFIVIDDALLQHVAVHRCILILFDLVCVLIAVPTTVFFPMWPPLVAIRFSASVELVSSNLFSRHNGGSPEEIVLAGGQRSVEEIARASKTSTAGRLD